MRFFVGLAALTYTLATVGPLGWFFLFLAAVALACLFLAFWPVALVLAAVVGVYYVARRVERRSANPFR